MCRIWKKCVVVVKSSQEDERPNLPRLLRRGIFLVAAGTKHLLNATSIVVESSGLTPTRASRMEQTIGASSSRSAATTQAPPTAGLVPPGIIRKLEREAGKHWDKFYKVHEDRFFHDRHWTQREFGALDEAAGGSGKDEAQSQDQPVFDVAALQESTPDRDPVLLEVGCGVGNMVWPLLESVPKLKVVCCDFSVRAIDILKVSRGTGSQRSME